jgi:arylformamidase
MNSFSQIIDISLPLSPKTIVYPSNPTIEIETLKSASGNVVSKVTLGTHSGTHIDAPIHSVETGKSLDQIELSTFIGPCRVLDCTNSKTCITVEDIEKHDVKKGERILFKTTNSQRGYEAFYDDYVYLDGKAAQYLADREVALVAIDYLSIKQRGSKDNTPHTNLLSKNIPIIEGVDLSKVEAGEYVLVALPLKFIDIDGSPARVMLMK